MIRLAEPFCSALGGTGGSPLIAAQIQAQAASAGGGILREFWVGEDEAGVHSWLCRSGDSLWATAHPGPAAREAAAFLELLGGSLLQVDDAIIEVLGPARGMRRPVLAWHPEDAPEPEVLSGLRLQIAPPGDASLARAMMDLHADAGEVPPGDRWDNLYAELHLRCRRGAAAGAVLWDGEKAAACAALGSMGTGDAVVSHVCTLPSYRRRGLASQAVRALCRLAEGMGRRPVLCCREELLPLYAGVGFAPTGQGHWIIRTGETL